MAQWRPDIELDEQRVLALVDSQFPELDVRARGVTHLASGWDKAVWRVGPPDSLLAFAFVVREVAVPLIERELAVLPAIAPRLPLPVPKPTHVGQSTAEHSMPWFGFELVPGREIVDADIDDAARDRLGGELGSFLRALHDPATLAAVEEAIELPFDANRRSEPSLRDRGLAAMDQVEAAGFSLDDDERRAATELFGSVPTLDLAGDDAFVHGDLHVRHVLVDDAGDASGVIDWGDACRAPIGLDLTAYWSELTPVGREHFRAAYGEIAPDQLTLGRACAAYLAAMIATSSRDMGDEGRALGAFASLRRTLV